MSKRVYISADYSENSGDRNVVNLLNKWGTDNLHKVDFQVVFLKTLIVVFAI